MNDPLWGIKLKLERAVFHSRSLQKEMHEFAYSDAFVIGADIDKEKREVTIFVEVRKPCPGTWSIIIGEMVHNLRSALDHLVWQLVILETSEQPVGDRTPFPIFESEEKVDHHAPVMLKG